MTIQALRSLRPQHWIKNTFVFLPLLFGQKMFEYPANARTAAAFAVFCAATSAVYVMNDLIDLKADRLHPAKRSRPLASGQISPRFALALSAVLGAVSLLSAYLIHPLLAATIGAYFALNLAYAFYLKKIVIVDVFCLAAFFLLRVTAGTVVAEVRLSHWIVFMIAFLAMFLGFNKRRQDLRLVGSETQGDIHPLGQYNSYFIDQMIATLTSSIVVMYALYTVDAQTVAAVGTAHLTYSIPFVYYGIFRYLYLVHKRKEADDPTAVLIKDGVMLVNIALWTAVCVSVIYFKI